MGRARSQILRPQESPALYISFSTLWKYYMYCICTLVYNVFTTFYMCEERGGGSCVQLCCIYLSGPCMKSAPLLVH
jgi:hypothetical protein